MKFYVFPVKLEDHKIVSRDKPSGVEVEAESHNEAILVAKLKIALYEDEQLAVVRIG
jgi:hypothetical protein